MDADPTASPMTKRMAMRTHRVGEKAAPRTPATKTTAVIKMTERRPIRSANLPEPNAPTAAPARRSPVTSSLSKAVTFEKLVCKKSRAPETTPVS
jgi:hypothetical protein